MNDSLEVEASSDIAAAELDADITFPTGFTKDGGGLWFDKGDGKFLQLAGPFDVLGLGRDPKGLAWGILLAWNDRDGQRHQGHVAHADLIGDGVDVFRPLVSAGLQINPTAGGIKLLKEALFKLKCTARVRLVKQTGWHNGSFVMPGQTFGDTAGERVLFDGNPEAVRYASTGNLEDWKEKVARPCAGNSRPVLACSAAFAGPLNDLLQGEGGGFHFVGPSSVGKSTVLHAAGSIWGGGGRTGYSYTWRGTENGLESLARAHSGTTLVLDEMGEADGKTIGSTTYMLMNGAGKARNTRDAELRVQSTWRIMLISSGELGLADKIRESGLNPRIGQLVRLVDVPADAGRGLGAFEDTKGMESAAFAEALKGDALRTFGTAGPAFVEYLAANRAEVEVEARALIKAIRAKLLVGIPPSDGQAHRVAERFALAVAAGELARRSLDLPWREGEAEDAATICFKAWREALGGDGPGELREALEALRTATERDGESRFRSLEVFVTGDAPNGAPYHPGPIRDLLGYRFYDGELVWGFTATGWKEVLRGIGRPQAIAALLADKGMLVTKSDRNHRFSKRIDGRTVNLYALKASALEEVV